MNFIICNTCLSQLDGMYESKAIVPITATVCDCCGEKLEVGKFEMIGGLWDRCFYWRRKDGECYHFINSDLSCGSSPCLIIYKTISKRIHPNKNKEVA